MQVLDPATCYTEVKAGADKVNVARAEKRMLPVFDIACTILIIGLVGESHLVGFVSGWVGCNTCYILPGWVSLIWLVG